MAGSGQSIRPTTSRIKKSIFDMLQSVDNKNILDLFAGSGALGFEAISRGACSATFVDKDIHSIQILHKNRCLFIDDSITIVKKDCFKYLEATTNQFDVIFCDPPYGKVDLNRLKMDSIKHLSSEGILVIESSTREDWVDEMAKIKKYGDTQISIFRSEN